MPPTNTSTSLTVHNLSNITLTHEELQLLSKGLSFSPTPTLPLKKGYFQVLNHFDQFAKSIRQKYVHTQFHAPTKQPQEEESTITSQVYRRMKFLPKITGRTLTQEYSGIQKVEKYIELTKNNINNHLPLLTMRFSSNVTENEKAAIKKFKQKTGEITIKPADKNLGLVLLNTDDYITQCINLLSDPNTYRPALSYPKSEIKKLINNTLICFKPQISQFSKRLYQFLLSEPDHCRIPQFYGIPKIHKEFIDIPPIRPIISQCSSLLNPTARFIDHVLQPLAQSYPDYLHNSTSLSLILQNLTVPDDATLVTLDVSTINSPN